MAGPSMTRAPGLHLGLRLGLGLGLRLRLGLSLGLGLVCGCTPWYGADDPDAIYDGSRCLVELDRLHCAHHDETIWTGLGGLTPRVVLWQVPVDPAPPGGWPVVILFQGTAHGAETFWDAEDGDDYGGFHQARLTAALLDQGYAVVTPNARLSGSGAWETNIPPMSTNWDSSGDHRFMLDIFSAIEAGEFGALDPDSLFAAGISSGGYMTSRMDLAYRGRFKALAIASGSWATCAGPLCQVPLPLDPDHLPTLFLHGDADILVPIETMLPYYEGLLDVGVSAELIVEPGAGHGWLADAPEAVPQWFEAHR